MASASEQGTAPAEQNETTEQGEQDETTARGEQEETTAQDGQDDTAAQDGQEETTAQGEEGDTTAQDGQDETTAQGEEDGDQEDDGASQASIAHAVQDVSSLPGETVNDQDGRKVGQVKEVYGVGDDEKPMWVTVESATGLGRTRQVFVPLARIKKQGDEIRVPYSFDHLHDSPEVEPGDDLSEEDDRALRSYYAIGLADQELVQSARSYASQVPDGEGSARKVDPESVDGPARELDDTPPAERVAEAYEKQKEEQGEEHRKGREATADAVTEDEGPGGGEQSEGDQQQSDDDEEHSDDDDEQSGEPKGENEEKQPEAQERSDEN